ncbi:LV136 protein, partial [Tricholaema leucomelas]|nr:LV136 protein [Tricholaema leucomelas]
MKLLLLLALAAAWSYGQAEPLLIQNQLSLTRRQSTTARIECTVEGVGFYQYFYIHWYQQLPSKPLKRILSIMSGQISYDDDSLRYKYSSEKQGTSVYVLSVNGVNSNDESTYYCSFW